MRITRFMLVWAFGLLGFVSSANAALLGVCTFSGGCGPDFFITGLNVGYVYNGVDSGVLTVSGATGNASFLPDQLDPWPDASETTGALAGSDPDVSIPVSAATGSDAAFLMTMTIASDGTLQNGSISMNGKVAQFFGNFNNTNPAFQTPGLYTASLNGVALDGALIAAGSSITAMGFENSTLDFHMALDASSLLSTAGFNGGGGVLSMTGISSSSGSIEWGESWSPATATLDVVVPLPAAVWLFLSGIGALVSVSRSQG